MTKTPRRIYFAHQSVGDDILAGIADLRGDRPDLGFDLVDDHVGRNMDPHSKFADFERRLREGRAAECHVAILKLCYVDVLPATDVEEVFGAYRAMVDAVGDAHPELRLVHVTVPLTSVQTGPKAIIKRLVGRPLRGVADNVARGLYNRHLLDAFAGREPVFDLAAAESTRPDGRRETFEHDGETWPRLVPAYTRDGGHLSPLGRRVVAEALLGVLDGLVEGASKGP